MNKSGDRKIYIVMAGLLVLLGAVYFNNKKLNLRIEGMESLIRMMNSDINSQYSQISGNIVSQVRTLISLESNLVKSYDFTYEEIKAERGEAHLNLDFAIKEKGGETDIFVLFKESDDPDWEEIPCERVDTLTYRAPLVLSLKGKYTFRFMEKGSSGGERELYNEYVEKDLYDEFYNRRILIVENGASENREEYVQYFYIENNTYGLEEFFVKSVHLELYYKDTLVFNGDIGETNREIITDYGLMHRMHFAIKLKREDFEGGFSGGEHFRRVVTVKFMDGEIIVLESTAGYPGG